ncbi:MAG: Tyrosine recombinase XerC [Gammaproteobacteria bacterium]|nr:Tyrosine recombinase XerC [Gammaproteobacteria bacterium]
MARQTILQNGKLDIHDFPGRIKAQEALLLKDPRITDRNKEIIQTFIRDCELGKTILGKQKKKIGTARLTKYCMHLRILAVLFGKDFDSMTQADMERFILRLERGEVTRFDGGPYAHTTRRDFKVTVRKLYKWLLGKNQFYPEIVQWIDTREVIPEVKCLRKPEIERMSQLATTPRDRAILWTLFDSGARAEEFLNLRYRSIEEYESEQSGKLYRLRIEYSKTRPRTITLPISTPYLRLYIQVQEPHPPDDLLFPVGYGCLVKILKRLGKKAVDRNVHPHLLRHSSATHYATRLSRGAFCNRFGWSYASNMADRYIDREALTDEESVKAVTTDTIGQLSRENAHLKEDVANLQEQLHLIDSFMRTITTDPVITQQLARVTKRLGQGEKLRELRLSLSPEERRKVFKAVHPLQW